MTDNQHEVAIPTTFKEAKRLLRPMAINRREIARLEQRRNKHKANIDARYDEKLEPLWETYRPMATALFAYVVAAETTLFPGKTMMKNFVHGIIKRNNGTPLIVLDDDELVKTLEQLGRDDLIIVKKSPDKEAIAKDKALIAQLPNVRIGKSTTFNLSIDPSPLGGSKPLTDKHKIVN